MQVGMRLAWLGVELTRSGGRQTGWCPFAPTVCLRGCQCGCGQQRTTRFRKQVEDGGRRISAELQPFRLQKARSVCGFAFLGLWKRRRRDAMHRSRASSADEMASSSGNERDSAAATPTSGDAFFPILPGHAATVEIRCRQSTRTWCVGCGT